MDSWFCNRNGGGDDSGSVSNINDIQTAIQRRTTNQPGPTDRPRKRAVLIGINYRGSQCPLSGCINDVHDVLRELTSNDLMDEVLISTDDVKTFRPTKKNILEAMRWLCSPESIARGDKLFFHYSGHGDQMAKDMAKNSGKESDGCDECLVPIDYQSAGFIIDDTIFKELVVPLVGSKSTLFVIFDACHSGTAMDLHWNYITGANGTLVETKADNSNKSVAANVVFFSGCRDDQTSADVPSSGFGGNAYGAMSHTFLQVMQQSKLSSKRMTFRQFLITLDALMANGGYTQIPQMSSAGTFNLDQPFSIFF